MKSFDKLSERQRNILRFIERYLADNGFPPTIRDIGEATKIASTSVVNYNLNKLVQAGYLERSAATSRGLRLLKAVPNSKQRKIKTIEPLRVPYIGQIVASAPVSVPEDFGHYIDPENAIAVPEEMLGGVDVSEVFALTVKGDSMIDAMIQNGDVVILRRAETASNGEMVAVWLDERNETTLKYFYKEGDRVRLQPAHPQMEAIYVHPATCHIQGKVLSVLRLVK